jgi:hypothetical protein
MNIVNGCGRFWAFLAGFFLALLAVSGCNKTEEAPKTEIASGGQGPSISPPTRSPAELREEQLKASQEELAELKPKITMLDEGDHLGQSRALLVEAVERFRQFPEVALPFFEFWLESDEKLFSNLKDSIKFANLHATKRADDFQLNETWLQKAFDEEFEKHWYGMGPLRGIGYATAEYLWKAKYVTEWADTADSAFTPEREKTIRSTLSRYFALNASVDQWRKSSTSLFSAKLTETQLGKGREMLAKSARFQEKTLEEFREWVSYNVISPRIGQASLLAWKADYCDKEVYQKRNTMKQAFSALEAIDPKILRECNDDVKGQYRSVTGEIDSICKKYPSIQANFQLNIETQFNIIKLF